MLVSQFIDSVMPQIADDKLMSDVIQTDVCPLRD